MDLLKMITYLRAERAKLDEAIQTFERLAATNGVGKRRGRPPAWLTKQRRDAEQKSKSKHPASEPARAGD